MALQTHPCQVNSATTITGPGQRVDAVGVLTTPLIYIVAATANFTANGVAVAIGASGGINFGNNPIVVNGDVTSATVGTVFYYIA
jgi:hypothetical protein